MKLFPYACGLVVAAMLLGLPGIARSTARSESHELTTKSHSTQSTTLEVRYQTDVLLPDDGVSSFGVPIAVDGSNMITRSPYKLHFYERAGDSWNEKPPIAGGRHIGTALAIDNQTALSINYDSGNEGPVDVYVKQDGDWVLQDQLIAECSDCYWNSGVPALAQRILRRCHSYPYSPSHTAA